MPIEPRGVRLVACIIYQNSLRGYDSRSQFSRYVLIIALVNFSDLGYASCKDAFTFVLQQNNRIT